MLNKQRQLTITGDIYIYIYIYNTLCTFSWKKGEETVYKRPNVFTSKSILLKGKKIYMRVMILRNVTSCSLVHRLQRLGRTCCIRLQDKQDYEDCGKIPSKLDMSSHLPNCMASTPKTITLSTAKIPNLCSTRTAWSL